MIQILTRIFLFQPAFCIFLYSLIDEFGVIEIRMALMLNIYEFERLANNKKVNYLKHTFQIYTH